MSTTREADSKAQRLFDVRTIERNIKKGLTNRKEYEKYLKALHLWDKRSGIARNIYPDRHRRASATSSAAI